MKWDDESEAGRTLRSLSQTRKGAIVEMGVMQSFLEKMENEATVQLYETG